MVNREVRSWPNRSTLVETNWYDRANEGFRILAVVLGFISLAAYHRFSITIGMSIDLLILSNTVLMFLCAASPSKPSRVWLTLLLITATLVGVYFVMRVVPTTQLMPTSPTAIFYLGELITAIWFIARNLRKPLRAGIHP